MKLVKAQKSRVYQPYAIIRIASANSGKQLGNRTALVVGERKRPL
jgi:hypothetical protein